MAPTSYCYSCVPMDEFPKKLRDRKLPVWVGILLFLLVATLMIALQKDKAGGCKQQELLQKLQEEIKTLNQKLQDKYSELEKLRKENEALVFGKDPNNGKGFPNSGISLRLSMAAVLLPLSLQTLLA
uniref:BST-2B n=2 Tax=Myotis TaxID=9434 RepID=A0A8F2Z0V6_MYOPI|nr:BST-2B [Myotis macropus]QWX94059.1 BST-2B [Myotis ricketti]